ncbi:uracil-DNA glycosylase [Ideonella margarita]|uniref:Uracil-DNA glycosylase n=1 Tax=Ideonella margarita TaxID=2984191 RepID=A0ABU9C194_9BURK
MTWTARQQAMLKVMGLAVWSPPSALSHAESLDAVEVADTIDSAPPAEASPPPSPSSVPVTRDRAPAGTAAAAPDEQAAPTRAPALSPSPAPDDRARHILTLSVDALTADIQACQACALGAQRRHAVPGSALLPADWAVVLAPPQDADNQQGEVCVGPNGVLLDNLLAALGLAREADDVAQRVFVTPAVKCHPPRDRAPEAAEVAQCHPYLARQLALVKPRVIIAMGRVAARQLLGVDEPLGKLRGQVHQWQGVPVVVSIELQMLMRQIPERPRAWADFCLAAEALAGQPVRPSAA